MKYDLPSGAVLDVTPLPYGEAWDVAAAILKEIEKIDLNLFSTIDFSSRESVEKFILSNFNNIKSPLCGLLSSKKILECSHACLKKCLYNDFKINGQTFESIEGRRDFLMCCFYALKENVEPFFEGLLSNLSAS